MHKILRKYYSINRIKLEKCLNNFSINNNELKTRKKKVPTLYYAESSLENWVPEELEKKIYSELTNYCDYHNLQLVILMHRESSYQRLDLLTADIKKFELKVKLSY